MLFRSIGAFEAQAIALEHEKIQPPRPMTHDLLRDTLEAVGADVTDIVIDELREGTFFAKIRFIHNGSEGQLDARPSDAVALAVRVEAPIYVSPSVLEEAGIPAEEEGGPAAMARGPGGEGSSALSHLDSRERRLGKAISEEDYERAARLRDEIQRIRGDQQN